MSDDRGRGGGRFPRQLSCTIEYFDHACIFLSIDKAVHEGQITSEIVCIVDACVQIAILCGWCRGLRAKRHFERIGEKINGVS